MNAHTRQVTVERKGERTPHKPKPWSHQVELQRLNRKLIRLTFLDQPPIVGTLIEADQFTLRLAIEPQSIVTFFKHAIVSYGSAE